MPTWMVKKGVENPPRVMIVSIDPLRTDHPAGDLLLSTPFGFHSKSYRDDGNNSTSIAYNLVWRLLNEKDACVYLTDCIKFFASRFVSREDENGDKEPNFVGDNLVRFEKPFKTILDAEIAEFNPDVVLILGKDVAEFCGIALPKDGCDVQEGICGRKCVACYHPSYLDRNPQISKELVESGLVEDYLERVVERVVARLP